MRIEIEITETSTGYATLVKRDLSAPPSAVLSAVLAMLMIIVNDSDMNDDQIETIRDFIEEFGSSTVTPTN